MKRVMSLLLLLVLCAPYVSFAQELPGTSRFPVQPDTRKTLIEVGNRAVAKLAGPVTSSATSITLLGDISIFPPSGLISIDDEVMAYTAKSGDQLTGLLRAQDGTTAAAHSIASEVSMKLVRRHTYVLGDAIMSGQAKLGITPPGLQNTPVARSVLSGTTNGGSAWLTRVDVSGRSAIGGLSSVDRDGIRATLDVADAPGQLATSAQPSLYTHRSHLRLDSQAATSNAFSARGIDNLVETLATHTSAVPSIYGFSNRVTKRGTFDVASGLWGGQTDVVVGESGGVGGGLIPHARGGSSTILVQGAHVIPIVRGFEASASADERAQITDLIGVDAVASNASGAGASPFNSTVPSVANLFAVRATLDPSAFTTNSYGLFVRAPSALSVSSYGLYIDSLAGTTNNWPIYSITNNPSYLAGQLRLGQTANDNNSKLVVNGVIESAAGGFRFPDGSVQITAGGGVVEPGGLDSHVQFKDGSGFGGDSGLTFNKTADALGVLGRVSVGNPTTPTGFSAILRSPDNGQTGIKVLANNESAFSTLGWSELRGSQGMALASTAGDVNLSPSGNVVITNGRLHFGGSTSSFPALKRSATVLQARLADDSAYTDIEVADEPYDATAWNGSNEAATKNAIRDKIETLGSGSVGGSGTAGRLPYLSGPSTLADSPLIRTDASTVDQRNGATPQFFRVFGDYTDASNYRGIQFNTNYAGGTTRQAIEAIGAGSGANPALWIVNDSSSGNITFRTNNDQSWEINASGHLLTIGNNTRDLASAGTRVRTGYFGTSLVNAGLYQSNANSLANFLGTAGETGATVFSLQRGDSSVAAAPAVPPVNWQFHVKPNAALGQTATNMMFTGIIYGSGADPTASGAAEALYHALFYAEDHRTATSLAGQTDSVALAAFNKVVSGSNSRGYAGYDHMYLASTAGNGVAREMLIENQSGADSPLTAIANRTLGLALTAAGANKNGIGVLFNSAAGQTSAFKTGIHYNLNSIATGGAFLDVSALASPMMRAGSQLELQSSEFRVRTAGASAFGPSLSFAFGRGAVGAETVTQSNDQLGAITALGHTGSALERAATIAFYQNGGAGVGDMPGRIDFFANPDGSATLKQMVSMSPAAVAFSIEALNVNPYGSSAGNVGVFKLFEDTPSGSNFVGFQAPNSLGQSTIYRLPSTDPTSGQVLTGAPPSSGIVDLSWTNPAGGSNIYDLAATVVGRPDSNEPVQIFVAVRAFTLPGSLAGSQAYGVVAATGSTVFTLKRRAAGTTTDTSFATITFSAGGRVGAYAVTDATQLSFSAGDILIVTAPAGQDATLADISLVLKATY